MPILIIKDGPDKGEERMRVKREGYAKPLKLRKKGSDTGRIYGEGRVGEAQSNRERSHGDAMDLSPRSAGGPEDYDEDKPSNAMLRQSLERKTGSGTTSKPSMKVANDETPARLAAAASAAIGKKARASVKPKRRKSG